MSRFQQIRVRVEAVYKKSLAKDFPKTWQLFTSLDPELADAHPGPPLYDLCHHLAHLAELDSLDPVVAGAVQAHGPKILELRWRIEELIGGWKLGPAEKLLNDLDDEFLALESDLPKDPV
ncbi:MAG: hypothetical protein KQJ78_07485 [Deltaproteobacteria bacterium]|nr:hypothetical protein [Deltaproteobacteria bacterium]